MLKITKMLTVVVCVVVGLTSSASANNWHDTEHPPVTTGNLWSDDANWTDPGAPTAGMSFRIEQYLADALGTGTIIMDVDYSADALNTAEFFGCETVSMQNYFKVANRIKLVNGGNGPAGSTVRVDPTGTIWGDVSTESSASRLPPTIDFAGGDWAAGDLWYGNEQRSIFRVSGATGSITPGAIEVRDAPWDADNPNRWPRIEFVLASAGAAPVTLTDADPLQFTNTAAGTNPFKLSVDVTGYAGPAVDIPLFIFDNADTDRMFDPDNITIEGVPVDWTADVEQTDDGVTLNLTLLTVPGDVDGDGDVDDVDLGLFEGQFGSQAPGTYTADFDGDEDVDLDDFAVMRDNIVIAPGAPQGGAATPEPATLALLLAGGLGLVRRKRAQSDAQNMTRYPAAGRGPDSRDERLDTDVNKN